MTRVLIRCMYSGTGSGSFSHSIARTIGPSGRLYSYEFHEARASKARSVLLSHFSTPGRTLYPHFYTILEPPRGCG